MTDSPPSGQVALQGEGLGPSAWRWFTREVVFCEWWVRLQVRVQGAPARIRWGLVATCAVLAVVARLWAQRKPGNWDFNQWNRVSDAFLAGQNPYDLYGYNYSPVLLWILGVLKWLEPGQEGFRLLICLMLSAVDIGIAVLLARRGYALAACLFLLSPVTIAISGYHQQYDNIAVLLALGAMLLAARSQATRIAGSDWGAILLLGLSLSVKQVFLLLPVWLAMRPGPWIRRLFYLVAPPVVFLLFLGLGSLSYSAESVIGRVLLHRSAQNSPLVNALVPHQLAPWVIENRGALLLSVLLIVASGLIFRRLPPFEMALAYTVTALLLAWAVANQYLAIPMAAIAIGLNVGFLIWLGLSTLYLGGDPAVLGLPFLTPVQKHVMLDYNWFAQDLFPWLLLGWVLMVFALRKPGRHMLGVLPARQGPPQVTIEGR